MLKLLKSKPWIIPIALLSVAVIVLSICLLKTTSGSDEFTDEYTYADYVRDYSEYGGVSYEKYLRVLEDREGGRITKPVRDNHHSLHDEADSYRLMREAEEKLLNTDINTLLGL